MKLLNVIIVEVSAPHRADINRRRLERLYFGVLARIGGIIRIEIFVDLFR